MQPTPWIQLDMQATDDGTVVAAVSATSDRRQCPPQRLDGYSVRDLVRYGDRIRRSSIAGEELDEDQRHWARGLYKALFSGQIGEVLTGVRNAAEGEVLVRLMLSDPRLRAVPWEAMRGPSDQDIELACHRAIRITRGTYTTEPSLPREVEEGVRILAVAPKGVSDSARHLEEDLNGRIQTGHIEWLPPSLDSDAAWVHLFDRLQRGRRPHVIHFVCHGRVNQGVPELLLDPDNDRWTRVDLLAAALASTVGDALRLVYLESCSGAEPGALASAAEQLCAQGVEAVVAHLWPVRVGTARAGTRAFYAALAQSDDGDVAAALNSARLMLSGFSGSEALCAVAYLRGDDARVLDFSMRQVRPPVRRGSTLHPGAAEAPTETPFTPEQVLLGDQLSTLFGGRKSLVIGDQLPTDPGARPLARLKEELRSLLSVVESERLPDLMQQFELAEERTELTALLQEVFRSGTFSPTAKAQMQGLIRHLARLAGPGLYVSLMWLPTVEEALAEAQPNTEILVFQPLRPGGFEKMWLFRRGPGESDFARVRQPPRRLDLDRQIVVLRMAGGFSITSTSLLGEPVLTDDDHLHHLMRLEQLPDQLTAWLRSNPVCVVGCTALAWRNRELMRRLTAGQPMMHGSLAIVPDGADSAEASYWTHPSGPGGSGHAVEVVPAAVAEPVLERMLELRRR